LKRQPSERRVQMELIVQWHKPIEPLDGAEEHLIYTAKGLDEWWGVPGVYMFARKFGGSLHPLYVGKAENIGQRVTQHFKSSTRLMNSLRKSANGLKVLVPAEFKPKRGQNTKKCIGLIERALIDHTLSEGHELLNVQGARTPTHTINFSGYLSARSVTG